MHTFVNKRSYVIYTNYSSIFTLSQKNIKLYLYHQVWPPIPTVFDAQRFIDGRREGEGKEGKRRITVHEESNRASLNVNELSPCTTNRGTAEYNGEVRGHETSELSPQTQLEIQEAASKVKPRMLVRASVCVYIYMCAPPLLSIVGEKYFFTLPSAKILLLHASPHAFPSSAYIWKEFAWASVTVCLVKSDSGVPGNCSLVPCSSLRRRIGSARDSLI